MPNKLIIIQQGESLPFKFDRGGASIVGWTCQIKVKQKPVDIPDIDRTITADDDRAFSGFLTRTETLNLVEGLWYLTGVITNEGTDEQEEIPVRFQVTKSWAIPNMVAFVTFVPAAGLIQATDPITLSTITAGATIHFTIDGSEPTTNSPIFTAAFNLAEGLQTVKAFAAKLGFESSPITSVIYNVAEGTVDPVTFVPPAGIILTTTLITLSTITPAATIHFTTDGSAPTILSPIFTAPFTLTVGTKTVKAFAVKANFFDSAETEIIYMVQLPFPSISGLFLRYDLDNASSVQIGVSGIEGIQDISQEFGADLFQSNGPDQPPYITAGPNSFADFDGSTDFMETGNFIAGSESQPNTIVIIFRFKNTSASQFVYDGGFPANQHLLLLVGSPQYQAGAGLSVNFSTTQPDTVKHNVAIVFDGATSKGFVDGGLDQLISADLGAESLSKLSIGGPDGGGGSDHADIEFYELVMYDRALLPFELNELGQYFDAKQNIPYTNI